MSTATVNSVAMADIATINDVTVPSGGSSGFTSSTTGLLAWGLVGGPKSPLVGDLFASGLSVPQSFQVWAPPAGTTIVKQDYSNNNAGLLLSNGDLYTSGSSVSQLGRAVNTTTPSTEFHLSLSNVSKFSVTYGGFVAIKTDGTIWFTGQISGLLPGNNPSYSYYSWLQYGTDTDWIDVKSQAAYPYVAVYVKGAAGSEYLYSSGYNNYGVTGQGLTSGTSTITRVKTGAGTDLNETVAHLNLGANCYSVVTSTGKLFTGGQNSQGRTGHGTSSGNTVYATQVGTDTNWMSYHPGAMGSFALKTTGQLYLVAANSSYYEYTHYNTNLHTSAPALVPDGLTDYEDLYVYSYGTSYPFNWLGVFAKRNGKWYMNGRSQAWNSPNSTYSTAAQYTWYDPTGSSWNTPVSSQVQIDSIAVVYNQQSTASETGIIIATS